MGGNKAIGFGLYPKSEKPYGMDKRNTRRNMANIRSERQGIDRLPGRAMPQVEVIDATYAEVLAIGKVNTATGEIVNGDARELPLEVPPPESEVNSPDNIAKRIGAVQPPEPTESTTAPSEGEGNTNLFPDSIIDIEWLREQLGILQGKGIKAYSNTTILSYLNAITRQKSKDIAEVASKLIQRPTRLT